MQVEVATEEASSNRERRSETPSPENLLTKPGRTDSLHKLVATGCVLHVDMSSGHKCT